MDNDGWTTQLGRRSKKPIQIPEHPIKEVWMDADCSVYPGSSAEYDQDHFNRYGRAEGMVDGKHVNKDGTLDTNPTFPQGSRRQKAHRSYTASTNAGNQAQKEYKEAFNRHVAGFKNIVDKEKQNYFGHVTDGLLPRQHEDLAILAKRWDENVYQHVKFYVLDEVIILTQD